MFNREGMPGIVVRRERITPVRLRALEMKKTIAWQHEVSSSTTVSCSNLPASYLSFRCLLLMVSAIHFFVCCPSVIVPLKSALTTMGYIPTEKVPLYFDPVLINWLDVSFSSRSAVIALRHGPYVKESVKSRVRETKLYKNRKTIVKNYLI